MILVSVGMMAWYPVAVRCASCKSATHDLYYVSYKVVGSNKLRRRPVCPDCLRKMERTGE